MPEFPLSRRHELRPLTGIEYLGESFGNLKWKSFRMRTGWTGEEREQYRPGIDRCPECGARIRKGEGNFASCIDCDWRSEWGALSWEFYSPPQS